MAERLILAHLIIDETGAVSGLAKINAGLKDTENQSNRTGQSVNKLGGFIGQLEGNMFSLRKIANAVIGGFTLAKAILAVKDLTVEVLKSDTAFGTLQGTITGFHEMLAGDGTKRVTLFHGAIETVTASIAILQIAIEEITKPSGPFATFFSYMFKYSVAGLLVKGITSIGEALDTLSSPGGPLERFGKRFDEIMAKAADVANPNLSRAKEPITGGKSFGTGEITTDQDLFGGAIPATRVDEETGLILGPNQIAGRGAPRPAEELSKFRIAVTDTLAAVGQLHQGMTGIQFAAQATAEAFTQAGNAIGAALSGEAVSGAQVLKSILSSIAKQAAVEGLFELAKGFAALFVAPPAAAAHFQSAGLFFATAALAGGGARAIGGGTTTGKGGIGGPQGDRGFGQEIGQQQKPAPSNLTVIIQGNVIGQEQYTRKLVLDLQTALRAGAGGGGI